MKKEENEAINKIKDFIKEISNSENEWEYENGNKMFQDAKIFLEYLNNLEISAKNRWRF